MSYLSRPLRRRRLRGEVLHRRAIRTTIRARRAIAAYAGEPDSIYLFNRMSGALIREHLADRAFRFPYLERRA